MKKLTKITALLTIIGVFFGTSANLAVAKAWAKTEKEKVFINAKVVGASSVNAEDVANAFEESLSERPNTEFVSEKGEGVEEITVILQVDDADDDDDGIADSADNDDNADGINDSDEKIATIDLDKDSTMKDEVKDSKPGQGLNIIIQANDEAHHVLKLHTEADVPEENQASAVNFLMAGYAPNNNRAFIPKWLKTTFTVIKYTTKTVSCLTGSISSCIGLTVDAFTKTR